MGDILVVLAVLGGFVVILAVLGRLAVQIRRRGGGAGLMNPVDEIFNPAAYRLRQETAIYEQRMVPLPSADDQRRTGRTD
jgi:hypothetical protein